MLRMRSYLTRSQLNSGVSLLYAHRRNRIPSFAEYLSTIDHDAAIRLRHWHITDTARITLEFEVEAPFWTAVSGRDPRIDTVRIHLTGVRDSSIAAARRTFEPDHFSIQSESPRLWRYGGSATIQCDAPIPDPDLFLMEFSDWLYARRASSDLREYCGDESFVSLARRLSRTTFLLLAGPTAVVDEAARRLERLGVAFQVDSSPHPSPALLDVTFGESWVVCESAVVESPAEQAN